MVNLTITKKIVHLISKNIYRYIPKILILILMFLIFKTNLPVFKIKESSVRRRFSDFEWLRNELEKGSKVYNRSIVL